VSYKKSFVTYRYVWKAKEPCQIAVVALSAIRRGVIEPSVL
jgi:hypothetical protein